MKTCNRVSSVLSVCFKPMAAQIRTFGVQRAYYMQ